MKDLRFSKIVLPGALLLLASYAFSKDKDKDAVQVFHGVIEDSQCAYNVHSDTHSHEWMIKKGVEGATDERSCTQHCVKDLGGVFVLVVKSEIYRLDDQMLPEQFAGKKVAVTATLDTKPHTLRVLKIEEEK
ncbi:MAG TPA: hypothetical protein VIX19_01715 [Terriglobales bacterium]